MGMFKRVGDWFKRKFRKLYEDRISLPYGIKRFLQNFAYLQLEREEFIKLNPPSAYIGDITLTAAGGRPLLSYPYWKDGVIYPNVADYEALPPTQVIVEERGFQVKDPEGPWELVEMSDERVFPLKDLFLGFAIYAPMRREHKAAFHVEQSGK